MRIVTTLCAFLLLATFLVPAGLRAEGESKDWRQRKPADEGNVQADDVAEEIRFGRQVAARILGRHDLYENSALTKYVNLVGRLLAMNANRPELDFHFAVLNTDEINGYAAPGGYVFVTRGAVMQMKDEAELAGVLAHEIAHIAERQIVRELNIKAADTSSAAGMARLVGGSSEAARAAFSQAVDKAVDMLFKDGYKREDEIVADKTAIQFCALAGYDPGGLARYFERIKTMKKETMAVLDKTHPPFDDRIKWLKESMAAEGLAEGNLSTNKVRFDAVMAAVK